MKNNRKQRGAYNEVSFRMVFLLVFLMTTVTGFAQNKTVSGIVVDKAGEAVIGASVLVKGTSNGTITDFDGNYTLVVTGSNAVLQFSYVGYQTLERAVAGKTAINITLKEDAQVLDEVVVTALGIKRSEKSAVLQCTAGKC